MRQILTNLLHNALKWTDEGVVSLHLYCGTPCTDTQANLVWEVRDTGAGISTDRHEAIFTPFEQVDNSLTRRHGGTGLGLAICRRLVELMGAQIEVESSEGQGSCFRITGSVKLVQSAPLDSGRQLAGKTVLVADTVELSYMAVRDAALALGARVVRLSESPTKPVMSPLLDDQTLLVANENALYELDQDTVDDLTSHGCPVVLIAGAGGTPLRPHPNLSIIWAPGNRADLRAALLRWDNTGQTAVNAAKHSYPQFGLNILAAEDNEINQDLLKRIVGKFGCRVDIAGDGVEAVAKWRDTAYDLILMDCQMPHLNGFAATREIRSAERESTRPYTPIVGLTGNAQEESKNNCLDAGMDDYLEKPYRINDLAVVIQRVREPERAT
ncbi:MAG: response regulator [Alphaproteobacteria bacterium]|nr:response regulator [Alphaproteobacteria bacterium]